MIGILVFGLICVCLILKLVLVSIDHAKTRRHFRNFPQLPTTFLLGETSFFRKKPINLHFVRRLCEIADNFVHGDKLFVTYMTNIPAVFIFNKNYIKQVLSRNDTEILNKGIWMYSSVDDTLPNSILTVPGDKWKIRRKILSQPFHTTNFDNFVKIVNLETRKLVKQFKVHECEDTMFEMKKFVLTIFCKLLFEYDIDDEIDESVKLIDRATEIILRKGFGVFLISPALYRLTNLATEENLMLKDLMIFKNKMLNQKTESSKESLKSKLSANENIDGKSSNFTLIEILLKNFKNTIQEKTAQWSGFDMQEIKSQLDTFIIAGFDTLSVGLVFLLHHLAKYPNYQEQIYQEIQQVLGSDSKRVLQMEDIKQMVFLEAFVNESLRIQPIVPFVSRKVTKDFVFDEKYTVPVGTDIVIFIEKVLKDPDYFPEPDLFLPERFLENQKDNLYVNIPFSAGPRNCIAKRMALQVLNFAAADLVRNFVIKLEDPSQSDLNKSKLKFELVNKPIDKIGLKFIERH